MEPIRLQEKQFVETAKMYMSTNFRIIEIPRQSCNSQPLYEVNFNRNEEVYTLATQRGHVRQFKSIDTAFIFLKSIGIKLIDLQPWY